MRKQTAKSKNWIRYYDERNILDEITDEAVDLILDQHLRDEILSGKRKRKLKNITIKIDPLQVRRWAGFGWAQPPSPGHTCSQGVGRAFRASAPHGGQLLPGVPPAIFQCGGGAPDPLCNMF